LKWTRRRKIGVIIVVFFVIVFFIIWFAPATWFVSIPEIKMTVAGIANNRLYPDAPPVSYRYELTFTASGAFSVNNPIHVKVVLKNVNMTNFLDYYCGVSFSYAYNSPIQFSEQHPADSIIIYLNKTEGGTYSGEDDVVWLAEGQTCMIEVINNPANRAFASDILNQASSVLTISSVSETLAMSLSQSTAKLAWQLGSFSIIVLEPAFEAIWVKDEKPQVVVQQPTRQH